MKHRPCFSGYLSQFFVWKSFRMQVSVPEPPSA
jgi:hypothetical protein